MPVFKGMKYTYIERLQDMACMRRQEEEDNMLFLAEFNELLRTVRSVAIAYNKLVGPLPVLLCIAPEALYPLKC
jgi:hypothetical protein